MGEGWHWVSNLIQSIERKDNGRAGLGTDDELDSLSCMARHGTPFSLSRHTLNDAHRIRILDDLSPPLLRSIVSFSRYDSLL